MKLNKIEFMLVNNPLRALIQEKYELKILRNMSNLKNIETALEIGCGNGNGTKLIKKYFNPKTIAAIDLDDKMINIARSRNKDSSITFKVMDASKLEFPQDHFDAVFDFGIIHHIPNWKDCINEIKRILKSNGELILEDISIDSFSKGVGRLWKVLLDHPYKHMFSTEQFTKYLRDSGFIINDFKTSNPLKFIKFFSLNARKT